MKDRLELVVQHSNSLNPKYFAWCIKFRDGPVCGNDSTNAGLVCFAACVCAVNTPRPPAAEVALLVWPRRSKDTVRIKILACYV